ncbi:MAG: FAD-dependent oxidoreductase [Butyricicoccus sp.]|nr:FAD-dependent oxidoreductase [Butyricicoccus sp.]
MKPFKLADNLYWNGILDPDLRVFDIVMMTEFGTTYNSYTLHGSEKTAMFETCKLKFWDEYEKGLNELGGVRAVDYLIMNHTEPDHAGTVEKLIELNPRLVIVGTATAIGFLKEIVNRDFNSMTVKDGDTLSLGDKTLRFMVFPNLHWPDSMYTHVEEDGVFFTCDSFGSHYSHPGIVRSSVTDEEGYLRATKYYFDNIIGPYANPYMSNALKKLGGMDIKMICTGHGPVLDSHLDQIFDLYRQWCALPEKSRSKLVVMPYVSAYGYTAQLAGRIASGVRDAGDITVKAYDMVTESIDAVAAQLGAADGILLGTPTIIGEALSPIWQLTLRMFPPVHKGKLASAFGSYGWSGEGVPHIIERLKQLRMKVPDDGFRIRFKPSEKELLDAYDFGYSFGCTLLKKPNERAMGKGQGTRTLVKCLVCGAIFDSGMDTCPVCGVGSGKFVEVEDTATSFRKDTEERFVILGGGPGAHYAAEAIRERNATASIVMITSEDELPCNRPMLTKALLQDMSGDRMAIESRAWYGERNITVNFGTTVQSVVPAEKKVVTDKGEFVYDKLVYALGARCFMVPIPSWEQEHVVSIRSIADCKKVQAMVAKGAKTAVVIGGGVMGLESGWELKKGGADVTVLETAPGLLPRQLDDGASALLQELCEKAGVKTVTGARITEITADAVVLDDGTKYDAELVIMSTGMRGNIAVAQEAGLKTDKLIVVDDTMATSAPDVWACGDCVEFEGNPQAFWAQAAETGRVAGANAAGEGLAYHALGSSLAINAMNTSIFALGTNGKDGRKYRTVEMRDGQRGSYEKYYFFNNRLAGVILVGDTSKMAAMMKAVEEGASFSALFGK